MSVYIIDYGMGNLLSVKRAFEKCNSDVYIANKPSQLFNASHIILPGVGAFNHGMKNLKDGNWVEALNELVLERKIPLLGICLGMQLLAEVGFEMGKADGLGYIQGSVCPLIPFENERIPHVGWNDIIIKNDNELTKGITNYTNFYFVHSYYFRVKDEENIITTTPYAGEFASIVNKENIYGTQFHPEKSQKAGFRIIKNFLSL